MDGSHFSDEMSDEVTIEQQRKEELAAMVPPSEGSVASGSSRRTEQWVDETCRERTNEAEEEWPNSNMTNELAAEEGCSRAPLGEKTSSRLQITVDEDLTYTGNTSCARPQGPGVARGNRLCLLCFPCCSRLICSRAAHLTSVVTLFDVDFIRFSNTMAQHSPVFSPLFKG